MLTLSGVWAIAAVALAAAGPGAPSPARAVNGLALGLAGLYLFEAACGPLSGLDSPYPAAAIGGGIGGAFLGGADSLLTAGWSATPWLAGAAVLLGAVALRGAGRPGLAVAGPGRSPAGRGGRTSPGARAPADANPDRSWMRIAWGTPLGGMWAILLLGMSATSAFVLTSAILVPFFLAVIPPLILQASLHSYRRVFALPLPRDRAFRLFVVPAWLFLALCLVVWTLGVGVKAGSIREVLPALFLLLALATTVCRLQLSGGRRFEIGFGLVMLLLALVAVVGPEFSRGTGALWRGLLGLGGGAGAFAVAGLGAGITAVLFRSMSRAFARLQWTDLPESSWRLDR
jgi:hypothetical protein